MEVRTGTRSAAHLGEATGEVSGRGLLSAFPKAGKCVGDTAQSGLPDAHKAPETRLIG